MPQAAARKPKPKPKSRVLPEVLTLSEAARFLRLPVKTVEKLATEGALPGRKIGKEWRFWRGALERWLEPTKQNGNPLADQLGAFADDPNYDQFVEQIRAYRRQLDAELS